MKIRVILFLLLAGSWPALGQSFDPTLASQLQQTIDSIRSANNMKGISACVIYPGQGTWKGVSGISHPGTPVNSDMEFAIASNTKLFTGVLLLKLAENNLLQLDDSIYHYLPSYNNIDSNITIRQLLNHTSGLDDVTSVPGYPDSMLTDPNRIFTAAELMTWTGPPAFAPGTDWEYCNTNYLLAAMIAESVTGRTYAGLLRDSILTPLQLDSTFLDVYETITGQIANPWQGGINYVSTPRTSINSAAWAAGGMYSTSGEMTQWYQALMSGQVINQNSMQEMTTFVGSGNYGIGMSEATINGHTVWLHGGSIWGGYNSSMMYDTTTGIIICVLTNQFPAYAFQIASRLHQELISFPLGTKSIVDEMKSFSIHPNPVSDILRLVLDRRTVGRVQIFDETGRMIIESTETTIDVQALKTGHYFIVADTDKGRYASGFLKD